jgi:hypothetical protein
VSPLNTSPMTIQMQLQMEAGQVQSARNYSASDAMEDWISDVEAWNSDRLLLLSQIPTPPAPTTGDWQGLVDDFASSAPADDPTPEPSPPVGNTLGSTPPRMEDYAPAGVNVAEWALTPEAQPVLQKFQVDSSVWNATNRIKLTFSKTPTIPTGTVVIPDLSEQADGALSQVLGALQAQQNAAQGQLLNEVYGPLMGQVLDGGPYGLLPHYGGGGGDDGTAEYLQNSVKYSFVGDVFGAPTTALGVGGSIIFGLTGFDAYKDVLDTGNALYNWKPTLSATGSVVINAAGILPFVGVVKNLGKAAPLVKLGDDAAEATTKVGKITDAVGNKVDYILAAKNAPNKVPTPTIKGAGKVSDLVPPHVPQNWSKTDISDAIPTYENSIKLRKAEAAAFEAVGGGHVWIRKAHFERIVSEENFLRQLQRRLEELR